MSNASMNLHRVVSVSAEVERASSPEHQCEWVRFTFKTEDGSTFGLAAHTDDADALLAQIVRQLVAVEPS